MLLINLSFFQLFFISIAIIGIFLYSFFCLQVIPNKTYLTNFNYSSSFQLTNNYIRAVHISVSYFFFLLCVFINSTENNTTYVDQVVYFRNLGSMYFLFFFILSWFIVSLINIKAEYINILFTITMFLNITFFIMLASSHWFIFFICLETITICSIYLLFLFEKSLDVILMYAVSSIVASLLFIFSISLQDINIELSYILFNLFISIKMGFLPLGYWLFLFYTKCSEVFFYIYLIFFYVQNLFVLIILMSSISLVVYNDESVRCFKYIYITISIVTGLLFSLLKFKRDFRTMMYYNTLLTNILIYSVL